MGWLPILLALVGFVFFIAVVNYNSIKTHEEAIKMAFFNFCQTARARHTLLRTLNQNAPQDDCLTASLESDFSFKHFSNYLAFIQKEQQSINDSEFFLKPEQPEKENKETRKMIKSLQVLNHRQHIQSRILYRKIREYNTLVSSYPTRFIARTTGYKVI